MESDNGPQSKYLKGIDFIHATKKTRGSYTWRSSLSNQDVIAKGCAKLVHSGNSTSFWNDK